MSLATKKVNKKGLLSPTTSIFARPPTRTHFPAATRNVMGSTFLCRQVGNKMNEASLLELVRTRKILLISNTQGNLLLWHNHLELFWCQQLRKSSIHKKSRRVVEHLAFTKINLDKL